MSPSPQRFPYSGGSGSGPVSPAACRPVCVGPAGGAQSGDDVGLRGGTFSAAFLPRRSIGSTDCAHPVSSAGASTPAASAAAK
ncbi:hypothetical protein ACWFRJ_27765 [Streptomyces sp. NPDC055239]